MSMLLDCIKNIIGNVEIFNGIKYIPCVILEKLMKDNEEYS